MSLPFALTSWDNPKHARDACVRHPHRCSIPSVRLLLVMQVLTVLASALVASLLLSLPMTVVNSSPSPPLQQPPTLTRRSPFSSRLSGIFLNTGPPHRTRRPVLTPDASDTTQQAPTRWCASCTKSLLWFLLFVYCALFVLLAFSHRAQTYIIYLHWVRPPSFLFPLSRLNPYRLASSARVVQQQHLRGWHLLPPGPPFVDGSERHFDHLLARPAQRVVIFFHGSSGTRACPGKRVDTIRLLAAHFQAHIVTFDYSGFGDSGGRPSEEQLNADARSIFDWVQERVSEDTDVIVYGQSLGTFAAVDLVAHLSDKSAGVEAEDIGTRVVILDAPPASLVDAALTHPVARPFRILPKTDSFFRYVLREKLDSTAKVQRIRIPLLILHGEQDAMITIQQGERLYEAALKGGNADVKFVRFPTCGHNNVNAAPEYLRVIHQFFEKHLSDQCRLKPRP